jgi:membrane-associated protease RseP (regulator of RpoE activity)
MQPHVGDRKAIYDIGISGPLAGLAPAIACSVAGLQLSKVIVVAGQKNVQMLGEPLLFKLLVFLTFGRLEENQDVLLHPLAYAGWVGIFITGLNLIPIGQLDGGHVLYALLLRRAHPIAKFMLFAAVIAVAVFGYWGWSVMLMLLFLMGPKHPPTADDTVPLGTGRVILGWLTLAFILLGFTPQPFYSGR